MTTKPFRFRSPRIVGPPTKPIVAPGSGGVITDVDVTQLTAQETPYAQDVVMPNGIASFRGGLIPMGTVLTAGSNVAGLAVTDEIPPATSGTNVYNWGLADGHIQNSLGGAAPSLAPTYAIPYVVFQNEILWFPQDGATSIRRTPLQPLGSGLSVAGTLSTVTGSAILTGAGTAFDTNNAKSCYYAITPYQFFLLGLNASPTAVSVRTPLWATYSAIPYTCSPWGLIGVQTTVADNGTAQVTGATAVQGNGTQWGHQGESYGLVAVGDAIGYKGTQAITSGFYASVGSPGGDTALTLASSATTPTGPFPYRITRPLIGTHGCVHNGRLIVVGCAWQRRRVYYTPLVSSTQVAGLGLVPWTLGDVTNGNWSFSAQPSDANVCDYIDVPDENSEGTLIGVASTASGILVLGTDGAWLITGDFPNETIVNLAPDADCVDARSIVTTHGSVLWAGTQGIFQFTGGRVVDITANKRNAEYRIALAAAGGPSAVMVGWSCRSHYAVSFGANPSYCWVYDIPHSRWVGNHTITALAAWTVNDQDEAYIVPNVAAANQTPCQTHSVYQEPYSGWTPSHNSPNQDPAPVFILEIPPIAAGDSITQKRVTGALLRMGWSPSATGVSFQSVMDPGDTEEVSVRPTFGTDAAFTTNPATWTTPSTQRIRPVTDVTATQAGALGSRGRIFRSQITTPATNGSYQLKVFELELFTRTFAENR